MTGEKLVAATRVDNEKALDELRQRDMTFIEPGEGMSETDLMAIRERAAAELVESDYLPSAVFEKTRSLLEQYRSGQSSGNTSTQ